MSPEQPLTNRVRACRIARGWSQEELAAKAGISRTGVSAIETNRLVPSTSAALTLAAALECNVEDLFQLATSKYREVGWAWEPQHEPARFWRASVAGREFMYPTEATNMGLVAHDGVYREGHLREQLTAAPSDTLVIACCDPAVGLLASELGRSSGIRLLPFQRSSKEAISLLSQGLIHVAGVHLAKVGHHEENIAAVREGLSQPFCLLRGAHWQEGLAFAPALQLRHIDSALKARARWIGREPGSAVRQLLDELLPDRRSPRYVAYGHRGVAEAIRCGWADVGVCLRLASEEAGLSFLSIREEEYDFFYLKQLEGDPRIQALVAAVRSTSYRGLLGGLPGYDATETGELERVP